MTAQEAQKTLALCPKCFTPCETVVYVFGKEYHCPVLCKCQQEAKDAERQKQELKAKQDAWQAKLCKYLGNGNAYARYTFEADDRRDPAHSDLAMNYCRRWAEMKRNGRGLVLCGSTGTGKTYLAACIANYLGVRGVNVFITSLPEFLDAAFDKGASELMAFAKAAELLVIDDLGAESDSAYRKEKTFQLVNMRYVERLPTIYTTNYSYDALTKAQSIGDRRIFQRIAASCIPLTLNVERRRNEIKSIIADAKEWNNENKS